MKKNKLRVWVIIPARGGSKRIPRKNIINVGGVPLIGHSILQARRSKHVERVIVSTEDKEKKRVSKKYGAEVVNRPQNLAVDEATSESALKHVMDYLNKAGEKDPDLVVFLQCTSMFRKKDDIDKAIETLLDNKADSLVSSCRNYEYIWEQKNDRVFSLTYDYRQRKREQDMGKQYRENGSIYIFRPRILRKYNNRLGGKIVTYEMDYWCSFQIDRPDDVKLARWIYKQKFVDSIK